MAGKIKFQRWKDVAEIDQITEEIEKLFAKHQGYVSSSKNDDKALARKTWQQLSDKYWDLLFAIVDAQTESFPAELTFDEEERLFIDFGFLHDEITPRNKNFGIGTFLDSKAVSGVFPYQAFSDFIAECWFMITGQTRPVPFCGPSVKARLEAMGAQLAELQKERDEEFLRIVSRSDGMTRTEANDLCADLDQCLITSVKATLRTKEYREAHNEQKQLMSQERFRYSEAERVLDVQISIAQKSEEDPLGLPEAELFHALHDSTKILARKIIYVQQEEEKSLRRAKKISADCAQFSQQMMRRELKNMLVKKKEYMAVPAKIARCEQSLLCPQDSAPMEYAAASALTEKLSNLDMDMFVVPRIRMYGVPRVIFVPGQGWGTYDWLDHTILLPMFPVTSIEKSLAYGLGTFRWDSDEDRVLKNTYENIKDNRGKSILEMAASFYKDYFLWMTKEKEGYRILPRNTHKTFTQMFAPRQQEE
ncbi:MAG: hypothetical protein LBR71_04490 [Synergistaceae bacterium]|jgi:hypothetical protein|nr:hypothetical protein [Synergistaceae bacterium]